MVLTIFSNHFSIQVWFLLFFWNLKILRQTLFPEKIDKCINEELAEDVTYTHISYAKLEQRNFLLHNLKLKSDTLETNE